MTLTLDGPGDLQYFGFYYFPTRQKGGTVAAEVEVMLTRGFGEK